MKDVLTWAYNSRSVWLSGATVLLTALTLKYGVWLGLNEDQAKQVAGTIIVLAGLLLAKLAAQNVTATLSGGDGK